MPRRISFSNRQGPTSLRHTTGRAVTPSWSEDPEAVSRRKVLNRIEEQKPTAYENRRYYRETGEWKYKNGDEWFCGLWGCVRRMIGKGKTRKVSKRRKSQTRKNKRHSI